MECGRDRQEEKNERQRAALREPEREPDEELFQASRPVGSVPQAALGYVLKVFSRLEPDRSPRWDANFLAGPRIATDASFPGLHLKYPESTKFDAFAAFHGVFHRVEHCFHGLFRLHFRDVRGGGHLVDDVHLYHIDLPRDMGIIIGTGP